MYQAEYKIFNLDIYKLVNNNITQFINRPTIIKNYYFPTCNNHVTIKKIIIIRLTTDQISSPNK